MITIENLSYSYPHGFTPALQDVSLAIRPGQFVLLGGESGAGKSTLLRLLNGLVPHFSGGKVSGRITINGLDPIQAGPQALSHSVGFVFQSPESQNILDQVEAEIAFGLENQAIPPPEIAQRVAEVLELLALTPLRHRAIATLSGGERQKVAIAAALALRPPILALDEPTSQLDPEAADNLLQLLARLNKELGLTIVLVEHRLKRVLSYASHLLWLSHGRLTIDQPLPQALAHFPADSPLPPLIPQITLARPVLEARQLQFGYHGAAVLRGVNLSLRPGQATVLMGRNGCGKTTLLKCLVGLLRPEQGQVLIHGQSNQGREVADICRQVAYLPQNPDDLLFAETVHEELAITLQNHFGQATPKADPKPALLEQLGLTALAQAYPRDLSVGQRQRVALGAVMITRPAILLLDEPTRGLDSQAKTTLVSLWQQWQMAGLALLLVTHDTELASQIANQTLILENGQIVQPQPAQ